MSRGTVNVLFAFCQSSSSPSAASSSFTQFVPFVPLENQASSCFGFVSSCIHENG